MYAILSAIASFLVQPVIWITFLLIALALVKSPRWARRLRWTVIAVAIVFTNPWLYHTAMLWWEPPPLTIAELDPPYDDAIVLGGFTRLWVTPTDRLHLNGDGNRFAHAIELYWLGKVRRIVFVSGGKTSSQPEIAEADLAARTAARFGIPPEAIVALNTSRNTHENATECRAFYEANGGVPKRLLLVTSGFHARRSLASFHGAGLEVTLFPTDHRTGRNDADREWSLMNTVIPAPETVLSWGPILREWIGLLAYRLKGWT